MRKDAEGPTTQHFRPALAERLAEAQASGKAELVLVAGDFHSEVSGQTGLPGNRMPICCSVMQSARRPGDEQLDGPPSGQGPSLKIRYKLPR